jgi:hypothetical protein
VRDTHRDSLSKLRDSIIESLEGVDGAILALGGLEHPVRDLRAKSASRDINYATDRLLKTVGEIRAEFQTSKASLTKILGLLDEILEQLPSDTPDA